MKVGHPLAAAFLHNRPALMRYFLARGVGGDAEDLIQDLWLKVSSNPQVSVEDPKAYLMRMAHNLMLDRLRSAQRRRDRETAYGGYDGDVDDAPPVLRSLLARERLHRIDRTLAGLGERTELIFRRHRVDGVAQRDIASEQGISLSAVEKHLQKAYRAVVASARAHDDSDQPARRDKGGKEGPDE